MKIMYMVVSLAIMAAIGFWAYYRWSRNDLSERDRFSFLLSRSCGYISHVGTEKVLKKLEGCGDAGQSERVGILGARYGSGVIFVNGSSSSWSDLNRRGDVCAAIIYKAGTGWKVLTMAGGHRVMQHDLDNEWADKLWGWSVLPLNDALMTDWVKQFDAANAK